jgi:CYTH domain-containing protein
LGEDDLLWEVDEFEGELVGLIIAEVELEKEDQDVIIPPWTGLELTTLRGWSNAALSRMIMDAKQP